MNQSKILLKEIIENKIKNENLEINLGDIDSIYLKDISDNLNINKLYEKSIDLLAKNDFESALKYLIVILDLNNEHNEAIHLCKSVLYNISLYLKEKKAEIFISKYGSLQLASKELPQYLKILENDLQSAKENLSIQEKKRFSNDAKLSPKEIIQNIVDFKRNILSLDIELKKAQKDAEIIGKLYQMETYGKIINTLIEACLFPELF